MMEWYGIVSYLLINEAHLMIGLLFAAKLLSISLDRRALVLAGLGGGLVTAMQATGVTGAGAAAGELLIMAAAAWHLLAGRLRLFLFFTFFYEIGVGLWDFLVPAWAGVLTGNERFLQGDAPEHLIALVLVCLFMAGAAVWVTRGIGEHQEGDPGEKVFRSVSLLALLGMLGAVTLSEQTILPLDEDQVGSWIILSMVLIFAVMFYRLARQRDMEREIAQLKQEQAEILERDYQTLSRTYGDNAKLYHDLHNHIEAIYQCLTQGDISEAVGYCEELRAPVREISQAVWTGDKAVDYLIGSKLALARERGIRTRVNVEYPRNTNIRSVDLTAILGNLLDNALEGAGTAGDEQRFLYLTVRRINDMLIIKVENGYGHSPREMEGELLTSKEDKASHGWGLKSAKTAALRYDGTVSTEYGSGVFRAVATLGFKPVRREMK